MKKTLALLVFVFALCTVAFQAFLAFSPSINAKNVGWAIDLFNQRGGQGRNVEGGPVNPGEKAILFAFVTYNEEPVQSVLVAFEVKNPDNSTVIFGTAQTNSTGYASLNFSITSSVFPHNGLWTAIATASPTQTTVVDVMPFYIYVLGGISTPIRSTALISILFVELLIAAVVTVAKGLSKRYIHKSPPRS
jgi:hypothetical protein